jgi:hypothetical protein
MIHAAITLAVQLVFWLTGFGPWLGGVLMCAFYVGREKAQAEYRIIQDQYENVRANAPWHAGFLPEAWTRKSLLDMVLPMLTALSLGSILYFGGV